MTEELFRNNSYIQDCEAKIIEIIDEGIILDKTIFYPEGGGQPGDNGQFEFNGKNFEIMSTSYKDNKIVHFVNNTSEFDLNQNINCQINWERRFNIMRVHTCLHLLCSLIKAPVTGGQINERKGRLDFDVETKPDREFILENINKLIEEKHDVKISSITEEELDKNPDLVRTMAVQPPRGTGKIRMISIGENIDYQPCGGTHVRNTGEISSVSKVKIENKGRMNKRVILEFNN